MTEESVVNGSSPSIHTTLRDLGDFQLTRVLSESAEKKMIVLETSVRGSADPAVVIMEKLPFTESLLSETLSGDTGASQEMTNDIYGQYNLQLPPRINIVKANIIHPATQKHIEKYSASPAHLIVETPDLYHTLTLPFIQTEQFSLDWVYNILDHKKEVDRIIYENTDPVNGFILAPDFKWSGKQVEDLYCLAIVHKKGIKSLRDLNTTHLTLLNNIWEEGTAAIQEKYGLSKSKIRAYLHYQPSYYHLHVHFTNTEYTPPGVNCEKSHLLQTVISNIHNCGSYYRRANLAFLTREKDKLYKVYEKSGYFNSKAEGNGSCDNVLNQEVEEGDCRKVIEFLMMLGKAKHEPSGEFWETTYGETAWRMAVMSMCLPQNLDRKRLFSLALVSSFASMGTCNDENTEWDSKIQEVKKILRDHLPPLTAGRLGALFEEHSSVRRGRLDGSREHEVYRGLLELEETLLRWEEHSRETGVEPSKEPLLAKMARIGFPGTDRLLALGDKKTLVKTLKFLLTVSKLLRLKRTGWVNCKVREPETVAGHMFRMGVMGLIFSHKNHQQISNGDASVISVCHDMAECIIGDITPHCKVSPEEKQKREMLAFTQLIEDLPEDTGMNLLTAFKRYEDQVPGDCDAILTKDYDKFDMILQAYEYEKKERRGPFLQQFFDSTMTVFQSRGVKKWQETLLILRTELQNSQTASA